MDGNLTISYQRAKVGVGGRSLVRVPRQVDPVGDGLGTALGIAGGLGGGEEPLSIVEFRHLHSWPTSLALNRPAGVRTRIWAMGCPIHGRLGSDWSYKFIVISSLLKPISSRTDLFAQSSTFFSPHNPGRSAARGRRAHGGAPAHAKQPALMTGRQVSPTSMTGRRQRLHFLVFLATACLFLQAVPLIDRIRWVALG